MSGKATIYIDGIIGQDADLVGVIRQFKSFRKPSEVEVYINSVGGDVDEGMSIFNFLRNLNLPITTRVKKAYSMGSIIMMAGDVRLVEDGADKVMIHLPWGQMQGGAQAFENAASQLREIENNFIEFYGKYTSIDATSIRSLLEKETFLSGSEATEIGLATGTYQPLQAVAFYNDKNNNKKQMTKTEKFLSALASFINGSDLAKEVEKELEINALILQDANGVQVKFPDLATGDTPSEGDAVEAEGDEILMPDGSKITIEDGKVKEILPAPEETEETPEDEANAVEETEIETSEDADEDEIDFEEILKKLEAEILKKAEAKFSEKEEKLQLEIKALKKSIGSEIENEPSEIQKINNSKNNSLRSALQKRK